MRDRAVWLMTAVYAVVFTLLGALRYADHRNFVDFGIFAQTAASAFGCFCNAVEGSHYAYHFSPVLYIAGIVLWFFRSPIALIALGSIATALVIPPIAALVARRSDRTTARYCAAVVFLYPALAGLAFNDFHENVFAPAAVAWMLWAFDDGRMRIALGFAALALAVKEDQAIFLTVAGVLGWWRFRGMSSGRIALVTAIFSAALFVYYVRHIQPLAAENSSWSPERFYDWTRQDFAALLHGGLWVRLGFLALAFMPLLFLPFRSRMLWLAAVPLAEVLCSRLPAPYTMGSHYAGAWAGYVLVAFAFAVRRLEPQRACSLLLGCIALCAVELAVADPLHPGLNLHRVEARDIALDRTLAALPPEISIATQEEAYTHLALLDPYARPLPETGAIITHACFILLDRDYPGSPRLLEYGGTVMALVRNGSYAQVSGGGGIDIYRRTGMCR